MQQGHWTSCGVLRLAQGHIDAWQRGWDLNPVSVVQCRVSKAALWCVEADSRTFITGLEAAEGPQCSSVNWVTAAAAWRAARHLWLKNKNSFLFWLEIFQHKDPCHLHAAVHYNHVSPVRSDTAAACVHGNKAVSHKDFRRFCLLCYQGLTVRVLWDTDGECCPVFAVIKAAAVTLLHNSLCPSFCTRPASPWSHSNDLEQASFAALMCVLHRI